jgi:hypothetical protein
MKPPHIFVQLVGKQNGKRRTLEMRIKQTSRVHITFLSPAGPPLLGGNVMRMRGSLIVVRGR